MQQPRPAEDRRRELLRGFVNLDAEQTFLAAVLVDNEVFHRSREFLRADHFADALHGRILEAMTRLIDRGEKATPVTLKAHFDADPALADHGGARYLIRLATEALVTTYGAEDYARIIAGLARKRALVEQIDALESDLDDPDLTADDAIASAMTRLERMAKTGGGTTRTKREIVLSIAAELEREPVRYSTGLPSLDEAMAGGLLPGKTYGIAARKKLGKSVLLGTISDNLNRDGISHLFFAHEMTPQEIEERSVARHLNVNSAAFRHGNNARLAQRVADYAMQMPDHMIYQKAAGQTLEQVLQIASAERVRSGIKGIIVDYWQIVRGRQKQESEEQHLSNVAQTLAAYCRDRELWLLIASQVNQEGNTRGSEGIRMACDQLYAIHRDLAHSETALEMLDTRYTTYHNIGAWTLDRDGQPVVTTPGLWFHRNGPWFQDCAARAELPFTPAENNRQV